MTVNAWSLVRFLHVTGAIVWVGGQLLLTGVVMPAMRAELDPRQRGPVIHLIARRFALVANLVVLPIQLATGIALAWHRGVTMSSFDDPGYGRLLTIKLVLVAVSIVLAAVHGVLASRRPTSARPLALGGVGVSLAIIVFATALVP